MIEYQGLVCVDARGCCPGIPSLGREFSRSMSENRAKHIRQVPCVFRFDIPVVSLLPCFFPGDSGGFRLFYREREGTHESVLDRSALLLQIVLWDNFSFIGQGNLPDEI